MNIEILLDSIKEHNNNPKNLEIVLKAYEYASKLNVGQKRQSGEDYISHPLNVAYRLCI